VISDVVPPGPCPAGSRYPVAMPRTPKLKVYRTPIGFHDAYVAAPSQKAALAAWGSSANLFARGVAELVTDEALTPEPLANPGTVVRRARGTDADYMAASAEAEPARPKRRRPPDEDEPPPRARAKAKRPAAIPPKPSTPPRPSRSRLDEAETTLEAMRSENAEALAELRRQERQLQQDRRDLERRQQAQIERQEAALAKTRAAYDAAIAQWRG